MRRTMIIKIYDHNTYTETWYICRLMNLRSVNERASDVVSLNVNKMKRLKRDKTPSHRKNKNWKIVRVKILYGVVPTGLKMH